MDGQPKFVDDVMAEVRRIAAAEPLPGPAAWLPRRFRWAEMAALAAVAALLIAIVAPLFMGVRANAAKTLCLNNARLVAYATRVYANDHWDHMPSGDRWDRSLRPYVHSELVFYCPAPNGMLYGFPAELSGESLQAMVYPSATLTLFDQGPRLGFRARHHGVGSVAFLDGHVTALPSLPDLPGISRPAGPHRPRPMAAPLGRRSRPTSDAAVPFDVEYPRMVREPPRGGAPMLRLPELAGRVPRDRADALRKRRAPGTASAPMARRTQ